MNEKRRRLFSFINSLIHLWRRWKKNALGPTGRMIWPVGCSAGVPTTIEYHKLILDVQVGEQPPPVFRPRSKDRTNAPPPPSSSSIGSAGLPRRQGRHRLHPQARGRAGRGERPSHSHRLLPFLRSWAVWSSEGSSPSLLIIGRAGCSCSRRRWSRRPPPRPSPGRARRRSPARRDERDRWSAAAGRRDSSYFWDFLFFFWFAERCCARVGGAGGRALR